MLARTASALLLPLLLLLTACTTTQVHLFTQGVASDELRRVEQRLSEQGYEVHTNALTTPEGIFAPTLVYSAEHKRLDQVEAIGDSLLALGYDVVLQPASQGNHFYTQNNVGIYLKPYSGTEQSGMSPAGKEFNGDCEAVDAYLNLGTNREFTLEIIGWNQATQQETVETTEGRWTRFEDAIQLDTPEQTVTLDLIPFREDNEHSTIRGIKLLNDSDAFHGCSFAFRQVL